MTAYTRLCMTISHGKYQNFQPYTQRSSGRSPVLILSAQCNAVFAPYTKKDRRWCISPLAVFSFKSGHVSCAVVPFFSFTALLLPQKHCLPLLLLLLLAWCQPCFLHRRTRSLCRLGFLPVRLLVHCQWQWQQSRY